MKKLRISIFVIMEFLLIFCLSGILFTLIFDETPLIAIPESVLVIESADITYALVLAFVLTLSGFLILIINEFKGFLRKTSFVVILVISILVFIVIQGVLLYGEEVLGHSWHTFQFHINYFNLYESHVNQNAYRVFFDNYTISIIYSVTLMMISFIMYKDLKFLWKTK